MSTLNARRRTVLALAAAMMVASCQMVPDARFTSAQRAVLAKHGFEKVGGRYLLGINNRLLFPFDSSEIDPVQRDMLRDLARELASVGIGSASIEGHSSSEGDAQHNLRLSERRGRCGARRACHGRARSGAHGGSRRGRARSGCVQ